MKTSSLILACALAVLFVSRVATPVGAVSRYGLEGIDGVRVEVENIDKEDELFGVSARQIRTDIELRLRRSGVAVDDSSDCVLYVSVLAVPVDKNVWAISTSMEFLQQAVTLRGAAEAIFTDDKTVAMKTLVQYGLAGACTWSDGGLMVLGVDRLRRIRERIQDMTDGFVNEYLAANPRSGDEE